MIECPQQMSRNKWQKTSNVFYSFIKKRLRYCVILTQSIVLLLLNMLRNQNNCSLYTNIFSILSLLLNRVNNIFIFNYTI